MDNKKYIKYLKLMDNYKIKTFESFDSVEDSSDTINLWLESNNFFNDNGKWSTDSVFTITVPDYLIDTNGFLKIEFNHIGGNFEISDCYLISLKGCPNKVDGTFEIFNTLITNVEHLPTEVNENLYLVNNKIRNINEMPYSNIKGYINISNNELTSLEGCPIEINGGFSCNNNNLMSLEGGPVEVNGTFNCSNNKLSTLHGIPKIITGETKIDNAGNIPDIEIEFYNNNRNYTNYYKDLLNWIISSKTEDDIDLIKWPQDFIKKHDNLLKGMRVINKYNLGFLN